MKTGIELITQERKEQIEKHCRSIAADVRDNTNEQLLTGAIRLIGCDPDPGQIPPGWNREIWMHMLGKAKKERLIIAGALIAAEIDRIQAKGADDV